MKQLQLSPSSPIQSFGLLFSIGRRGPKHQTLGFKSSKGSNRVDGGLKAGFPCTDPGERPPIGMTRIET